MSENSNNIKELHDFIPVICHYDENSLLTKNGELLQIIHIPDIGSNNDNISSNLDLRQTIRNLLKNSSESFSFWIHTVRDIVNLNEDEEYNSVLSNKIYSDWRSKNNWDNRFVNSIYITILTDSATLQLNRSSFIQSLFRKKLKKQETEFLKNANEKLNIFVNDALKTLENFAAKKLGIFTKNNRFYSSAISFYQYLIQLNKEEYKMTERDFSLMSLDYKLNVDNIKIVTNKDHFISIVSIKEYQDIKAELIDEYLQLQLGFIITEIFYDADKEKAKKSLKDQDYILNISGASDVKSVKNFDKIFDRDEGKFFDHKISLTIMASSEDELSKKVTQISTALSKLGIIHAKEDINLDKLFWSRLPGNFSFTGKMQSNLLENICGFSFLQNCPIGTKKSKLGNAVTLLNTENNTPYFVNFYDAKDNSICCIFGQTGSGRTKLLNFLLSQADKYNPSIFYITNEKPTKSQDKSQIKNINPFIHDDKKFAFEFLKIITNHYFEKLSKEDLGSLESFSEFIFTKNIEERNLSSLIDDFHKSNKISNSLLKCFAPYLQNGKYYGLFEGDNKSIRDGHSHIINMFNFNKKLPTNDLKLEKTINIAKIFTIQNILKHLKSKAKILAIEDLSIKIDFDIYGPLMNKIISNMNKLCCIIATLKTELIFQKGGNVNYFLDKINTSFILPYKINPSGLGETLNLNSEEIKRLNSLESGKILIKQNNEIAICNFNIDSFEWSDSLESKNISSD